MKHNITKYIAALLAAALLPAGAAQGGGTEAHWGADALEQAAEQGWMKPEETADGPDLAMTRGGFVSALWRMDGAPAGAESPFADLPEDSALSGALGWAFAAGIAAGTDGRTFAPEAPLSREDAAVLMFRYLDQKDRLSIGDASVNPPADAGTVSGYAEAAAARLWRLGIFRGENGAFLPHAPLSRAETAALLTRLKSLTGQRVTERLTIPSFDAYPLEGKLDLPAGQEADKLVVFVNGSGPNTYDNRREINGTSFRYHDLFAEQLTRRGTAFFRASTRGVYPSEAAPMFAEVHDAEYRTYLPETSVQDIEAIVAALKADPRLKNARVYLLGWSEGTMIAPKVAQRGNVQVDALLLAGYCNGTMDEALEWQQSGASSMLLYSQYFDYDGDGAVSEAEFAEDRYQLKDQLGSDFTALDADGNGALTIDDFAMLTAPFRREMLDAIKGRDDQWLKENYSVQLTSGWFLAHRAFQPNREMLAALYLPIHIFHGTADLNVSVQGVYDIESTFQNLGKTNLTLHVFPGMDHDLNYLVYPLTGGIPESFTDLFQTIADLD